jgi:hypothetical protein
VGGGAHAREPALDVEAGGDVGVVRPGEEVLEIGGVPAEQVAVDRALGPRRARYQSLASSVSRVKSARNTGSAGPRPSHVPSRMMCSSARSGGQAVSTEPSAK